MRSILLLLIPLLAGGAVYWVMTSGDSGPSDAGEEPLSAGRQEPQKDLKASKVLEVDMSGARIAESMPEDIFNAEKAEAAIYEQPEIMDTRIEIPDGRETMSGDLILRSMARILGSERPFHFESAGALAEFKGKTFEGVGSGGEASLVELLSYCPRAGFGFFQRDKRLYLVRLPKSDED